MAGGGTELNSINGFHHPEFNVSESSDRPQTFKSTSRILILNRVCVYSTVCWRMKARERDKRAQRVSNHLETLSFLFV